MAATSDVMGKVTVPLKLPAVVGDSESRMSPQLEHGPCRMWHKYLPDKSLDLSKTSTQLRLGTLVEQDHWRRGGFDPEPLAFTGTCKALFWEI